MTSLVDITVAHEDDFPRLADIISAAMATDMIGLMLFLDTIPDPGRGIEFALAQLREKATDPKNHIIKATWKDTGEIVAYGIVCAKDGVEHPSTSVTTPGLNQKFAREYFGRLTKIYQNNMRGREHAYWNTLMVHPTYQRKGIGSAIINWVLENSPLAMLPIYLNAQNAGYQLYKKMGWVDLEALDIDLSTYAGPYRGFGLHRTMAMLRPSQGAHDD